MDKIFIYFSNRQHKKMKIIILISKMDKPTIITSNENENTVIYYYNYNNKDYLISVIYQQNSEKIQSITQL